MAGTDCIDIRALHEAQVLIIPLARHGPSMIGIEIMAVDALEQDRAAIDQKLFSLNLDPLKADAHALAGEHPLPLAQSQHQRIEIRRFRRPLLRLFNIGSKKAACIARKCNQRQRLEFDGSLTDKRSLQYNIFSGFPAEIGHTRPNAQGSVLARFVQLRPRIEIAQVDFVFRIEEYLAVNAAEEPHVLILQIGTVRIAVYLRRQLIFARMNIICDTKLGRRHGTL